MSFRRSIAPCCASELSSRCTFVPFEESQSIEVAFSHIQGDGAITSAFY
jgi:hypothetical protein